MGGYLCLLDVVALLFRVLAIGVVVLKFVAWLWCVTCLCILFIGGADCEF